MDFNVLEYVRTDVTLICENLAGINTQLKQAQSSEAIISLFRDQNDIFLKFITNKRSAEIRNLANLKDEFYKQEVTFLAEAQRKIEVYQIEFYKELSLKDCLQELEVYLGKIFFIKVHEKLNAYDPSANAYKKEESALINKYKDQTDKRSGAADLFIELSKVRKRIADQSDQENYVKYSYLIKGTNYDRSQILSICADVKSHICEVYSALHHLKAKHQNQSRINYKNTNELLNLLDKIDDKNLFMQKVREGLSNISENLGVHFDYLYQSNLIDYEQRAGKFPVSMNIGLPAVGASFSFVTIGDSGSNISTLLHEIGHAYQSFLSTPQIQLSYEYMRPTPDIAELQACSLEFFFFDQYKLLFDEKAVVILLNLFEKALFFIVKSCAYEELQRFAYETDNLTKEVINRKWLSIREVYFPFMDDKYYLDDPFYTGGNEWQLNFQIFMNPFNEMSYAISYIHAIDHWINYHENKKSTIDNYNFLCSLGGNVTYERALDIFSLSMVDSENKIMKIAHTLRKEIEKLNQVFCKSEN
jgi:oligoendopeptidase F